MAEISPELREAARALCRAAGIDPEMASSSAYAASPYWEVIVPHAIAAVAPFATSLRALAETARAAAMVSTDQLQAERLKARADALHEAADMMAGPREGGGTVVEFRRLR